MEEIIQIKAEAFDVRLKLDEADNQVKQYTQQTIIPLTNDYKALIEKIDQLLKKEQEAKLKAAHENSVVDDLQVVS